MRRERFQAERTWSGQQPPAVPGRVVPLGMALALGLGLASVGGANSDSSGAPPSVSGSLTARGSFTGGDANDRLSSRLSLEWLAGGWSGGFTLNLENSDTGGLWRPDDVGSLDMPERWLGWSHAGAHPVELRLGTAYGLRFGEGLVLGAASFEGMQLILDATPRTRYVVLAGDTDALDPAEVNDVPPLFPGQEQLGTNGRLAGVRAEIRPTDSLTFGVNGLGAELEDGPSTTLVSVDTSWSRGIADISAEFARRDGGTGAFVRTTLSKNETWGLSFELRHYDDFLSPVGNPPAYAGLTGGNTHDERGALVRYDFTPVPWLSGSLSTDWSEEAAKAAGDKTRRIDNRLTLRFVISKTTSLAWGVEHEMNEDGRDGTVQSFLSTTAFKRGGRLAARLQFDRATEEARDSLRLSYRLPLWNRRITLMVDDTLQRDDEGLDNEFEVGGSFKVGDASFVTLRATLANGPETVDVTWYQRF